ncbi:hypothetical protein HYY27_01120, partial [bacterium]|nr:hypothetical protein [bacterium]
MKRILLLTALSLGLFAADALAQPPGGGGGGGMGMMRRPDGRTRMMWMQFCFDLNATDEQVVKAWPI